jgi:polyhydroxybutyrate depolymerase
MPRRTQGTARPQADDPGARRRSNGGNAAIDGQPRRRRIPVLETLYAISLVAVAVAAFGAFTPYGNRWVPLDWAWALLLVVVLGVLVALVAIVLMVRRARTGSRPVLPRAALVLPVLASLATCQLAPLPSSTVEIDGRARTYRMHRPAAHENEQPRPLLLVLHGFMQDWKSMRKLTRFDRLADRAGALVVYPEGYRRSWNDGDDSKPATIAGLDDAAFLRAVIDDVARSHDVDERRIYAVGFSNSGFLLVRHACRLADRIAAIGVVAAGVYPVWDPTCEGARPMPAMFILGEQDPMLRPLQRFAVEPSRSGEIWAAHNGCGESSTQGLPDIVDDGTRVRRQTFSGCRDGADVVAVHVEGGGHAWPGGPQYLPAALVGRTSRDFDATDELWDFFSSIRLPSTAGRPQSARPAGGVGAPGVLSAHVVSNLWSASSDPQ